MVACFENQVKFNQFLITNADLFAFRHVDMTGISREIATHKLNVDPFAPSKTRQT